MTHDPPGHGCTGRPSRCRRCRRRLFLYRLALLWSNATQVGDYDVVVDFGNNSTTLAGFVQDDHYDMPLDIIDGYIVPGFRVVPDPAVDTSFAHVGSFSYTQPSVTVTNDSGSPVTVPLIANVRFPADVAGATSASQISAAQPSYPVVVCVHGNSSHTNSYQGYDYLLDHLALNGFIAVSIHMEPGQQGTDRARILQTHLPIIFSMFGTHAANNIGIMGHSRGGEAVVIAARLNQQEAWGWNINAVISLAPTNQYTFEHFGGAWARPYLVIYGSLDGDLGGIGDTGFELYDHASGMNKSMAFVYRACHDRFNTVWGDGDFFFGQLTPADQAAVLSANSHQLIAKGCMAAFFRQHLQGEAQWSGIFRGEWIPASVSASDANLKIYTQYEDTVVETVDDFEGVHTATSWQVSTIGGAVSQTGLPATPQENDLRTLDPQSPHLTAGLSLRWDGTTESLDYTIPAGQRDVSGFQAVSFRVSQKVNSASNPVNQAQDLRLTLTDGGGHSRAIRISKLAEIPYPYVRGVASLVKSAMCTIRIPLAAYHIHCLNVDQVDLTDVTALSFQFAEKMTGEIEIDSIQFTN
jgi:Chlorophyllase enzyme